MITRPRRASAAVFIDFVVSPRLFFILPECDMNQILSLPYVDIQVRVAAG